MAAVAAPSFGRWTVVVDEKAWGQTFSDAVLDLVFSPDGKSVAWLSDASGEYELYVANQDGSGEPRQLTSGGDTWRFAENLPLALMRPLSGSGSLGLLTDLVNEYGADSMQAKMGATMFGSSETTFYVIAVYFGSVGIIRSRHAIPAGLIADAVGALTAVWICLLLLGLSNHPARGRSPMPVAPAGLPSWSGLGRHKGHGSAASVLARRDPRPG